MALFPARDREGFDAHWRRTLADDSVVKRTIVDDGAVAGSVVSWEQKVAGWSATGRARVLGPRPGDRRAR